MSAVTIVPSPGSYMCAWCDRVAPGWWVLGPEAADEDGGVRRYECYDCVARALPRHQCHICEEPEALGRMRPVGPTRSMWECLDCLALDEESTREPEEAMA